MQYGRDTVMLLSTEQQKKDVINFVCLEPVNINSMTILIVSNILFTISIPLQIIQRYLQKSVQYIVNVTAFVCFDIFQFPESSVFHSTKTFQELHSNLYKQLHRFRLSKQNQQTVLSSLEIFLYESLASLQ